MILKYSMLDGGNYLGAIGSNSTVAAGTVMTIVIPPDVVVAGIPARIIKYFV